MSKSQKLGKFKGFVALLNIRIQNADEQMEKESVFSTGKNKLLG